MGNSVFTSAGALYRRATPVGFTPVVTQSTAKSIRVLPAVCNGCAFPGEVSHPYFAWNAVGPFTDYPAQWASLPSDFPGTTAAKQFNYAHIALERAVGFLTGSPGRS